MPVSDTVDSPPPSTSVAPQSQEAAEAVKSVPSTTTTTDTTGTTATTTTSETNGVTETAEDHNDGASATGKRKRRASSPKKGKIAAGNMANGVKDAAAGSEEDKIRRRREAVQKVAREMLVVMKEFDPSPSVLSHSLSALPKSAGGVGAAGSPPSKRTKLSQTLPDTIEARLQEGAYTSLSALVVDVTAVCQALKADAAGTGIPNGINPGSSTDANLARIVHFERLVKDLVTRQRKREADSLDLVEELAQDEDGQEEAGDPSKIALTVMGHHGPLFSSLQLPQQVVVSAASSSTASSTAASPKSAASTAATSVPEVPRKEVEEVDVELPFVDSSLPPLISTVKAMPPSMDIAKTGTREIKPLTIGEAFPPPPNLLPLLPQKIDKPTIGVKWGGEIGLGGINTNAALDAKSEPTSHWLMYTNLPQPGMSRMGIDPFRKGIGLDPNFVATFSSFAPTRDESAAKVSAGVTNSIWWERRGEKVFRKLFADDPALNTMFPERPEPKTTTVIVGKPNPAAAKEVLQLDEKELEEAIEEFDENIPIDEALLNLDLNQPTSTTDADSPSAVLTEISSLLTTLQSQQYSRFASALNPSAPPPSTPSDPELATYQKLTARLSHLISTLPPHITATIDGNPDSELALSKRFPLSTGTPVYKGTLPTDDPTPKVQAPATIRDAAMNAMNAAAGMSPVSATAPVAPMLQARQSTPMRPASHSPVPQYHQAYPVQQGYASPVAPPAATMGYHSPMAPVPRIPTPSTPHPPYHHSPVPPVAQVAQHHLTPGYPHYPQQPSPVIPVPQPQPATPHHHYPQPPAYVNPEQHRQQLIQQQQLAQVAAVMQQQQQQAQVLAQQQRTPATYQPPTLHQPGYAAPPPPLQGYSTPQPHQQQGYSPVTPINAVPYQQQQQQVPQTMPPRPRGSVPPPQGLAAVGVGAPGMGAGVGYTNTPGRYSTRRR